MLVPAARRPYYLLLLLAASTGLLLFLHQQSDRLPFSLVDGYSKSTPQHPAEQRLAETCLAADPFEQEYGRRNIRMSRAYEGSHERLQRFIRKALKGPEITISTIGGSVTKGHQVYPNEIWFHRFGEWLKEFAGPSVTVHEVNGAAPATGSDYFSMCFPLHIPETSDLVVVELAVNDEGILEHIENMENLLRGLLDMPNEPAVILVEAMAFSNGGMGGGGGRMHLPVAQYYDVPVINQRHPLANHFARYPELVKPYFASNYWGHPDTRHLNARGHRDLGMMVASLIRDAACQMSFEVESARPAYDDKSLDNETVQSFDAQLAREQSEWPQASRYWRMKPSHEGEVGQLMPGMWSMPFEYGTMPRMRVLEGWNPNLDHVVPPFHPTCLSTRSTQARFNLTPTEAYDWEHWTHPDYPDKPYLVARKPGALVSFQLETRVGWIKMYSLRSKTFGLGTVKCWVDDEIDRAVKVVGWWDKGDVNIGRFATIRTDLRPGVHTVTCELLSETSDPDGGHEFRMISMMSV